MENLKAGAMRTHCAVKSFMADFQVNSITYMLQYNLLDRICKYTNQQITAKKYAPILAIRDLIGNGLWQLSFRLTHQTFVVIFYYRI